MARSGQSISLPPAPGSGESIACQRGSPPGTSTESPETLNGRHRGTSEGDGIKPAGPLRLGRTNTPMRTGILRATAVVALTLGITSVAPMASAHAPARPAQVAGPAGPAGAAPTAVTGRP